MARTLRQMSASSCYHIMIRGINKSNLFEDDEDRTRFLTTLKRFCKELDAQLYAWCLMSNHVHLLLRIEDSPNSLMKKIGCSYVPYFNKKYERCGHLFQDRYRSEAITDDSYLMAVARYIHMNPEKAGICPMEHYQWSSYREYITGNVYCRTEFLLDILGGVEAYYRFMHEEDSREFLEDRLGLSESQAVKVAQTIIPEGLFELQHFSSKERADRIRKLNAAGLTASQISRITGLSKRIIYYAIKM